MQDNLTYTLSSLFTKYRDDALLCRLATYALWTIPSVFPKGERNSIANQNALIEHDYQSVGAGLVNRLSTKLARTLFPANTSFFRIEVNEELKKLMDDKGNTDIITYEKKACDRLFLNASYAQIVQALRLLVITGECLLYRHENKLRVYSLRDYVARRNNLGETLDIIICEQKLWEELTPEQRVQCNAVQSDTKYKLYTRIQRQVKLGMTSWLVTQEINGRSLSTRMVYRDKLCPYIPVCWNFVNGDNYARGYVEDYAADLAKYSDLSRELMSYQMECLRLLHLVDPASSIDADSAATAPNGEFISGTPEGIKPYEAGSYQKIQEIRNELQGIEQRLNMAFMYTGNTREGERVTAYEIRQNAEEAEQTLGGVYSQLSQSMHLPLAHLLLYEVRPDIIAAVDAAHITLNILTGIMALSRSSENQGLLIACSQLNAILPIIGQLGAAYNIQAAADSVFLSNGVTLESIKFTPEQVATNAKAKAEQAQASQAAQAAAIPQQLAGQESAVQGISAAQAM